MKNTWRVPNPCAGALDPPGRARVAFQRLNLSSRLSAQRRRATANRKQEPTSAVKTSRREPDYNRPQPESMAISAKRLSRKRPNTTCHVAARPLIAAPWGPLKPVKPRNSRISIRQTRPSVNSWRFISGPAHPPAIDCHPLARFHLERCGADRCILLRTALADDAVPRPGYLGLDRRRWHRSVELYPEAGR
jgi:hypothetical protein